MKSLNEQLQRSIGEKDEKIASKSRDVKRLTEKVLDQDEAIHQMRHEVEDKQYEVQIQKAKMKDFESTIIEKNIAIAKG